MNKSDLLRWDCVPALPPWRWCLEAGVRAVNKIGKELNDVGNVGVELYDGREDLGVVSVMGKLCVCG